MFETIVNYYQWLIVDMFPAVLILPVIAVMAVWLDNRGNRNHPWWVDEN